MTYKGVIESMLEDFIKHDKLRSAGYGSPEEYDTDKDGKLYPRLFISLVEADRFSVQLTITVTDEVLVDLSNRLDVQSRMLTLAKELHQRMIDRQLLPYDVDTTFEPTRLYQADSTEGVSMEVGIMLDENIDICDKFINE